MNFSAFKVNDVLVWIDGILSSKDERGLGFLCSEGDFPSLAPGGYAEYALQRLIDADDSVVVLTPLTGECENTVVCIRCCFRDQLEEVIEVHVP